MILINEFLKQVKDNPNSIAASTEKKQITYKEMDEASQTIAAQILKYQLEKGHIALIFDQGIDMITAVLSVLKAGKTYIPLSNHYPDLHMSYIAKDAQFEMIITNNINIEKAHNVLNTFGKQLPIINIDDLNLIDAKAEKFNLSESEINDIAYILYTSGSTGTPKGVVQNHRNILHFAKQYAKRIAIGRDTRMTLFSSFCHDAAVIDIFSCLLHGATLYPKDIRKENDFQHLVQWLQREKINVWHSVPTLYRHFTSALNGSEKFDDLKYIVLGGENVTQADIERYKSFFGKSVLVNLYGQSESSYNSSQFITSSDEDIRINIGEVVEETQVFVVDENNEEVMPLGVGEIVINSPYIALGYWNRQEESAKVFDNDSELGALYWTGDLGRLESNGAITWLGRKDSQVKIRGFRVELQDIENCILQINSIKAAALVTKEKHNGEMELICYYTSTHPITKKEIRQYIGERLPDYMVPNTIIEIDSIPLTPSGKVDRRALQALEVEVKREMEYSAPKDDVEEKLVRIWEDILSIKTIGVQNNFFELGGHSLKVTLLNGRIRKEFEVEVGVGYIFDNPTIEAIAKKIKESHIDQRDVLKPSDKKESYPVSSAQKRLYAIHIKNPSNTSYNMPMILELTGKVDVGKVEKAMQAIIQKHEAFRTSFHMDEANIVQKIQDEVIFQLGYQDISSNDEMEKYISEWIKPFDLEKAPLMRADIIKNGEKYILLLDMHHIISDGTTMSILGEDFAKAYQEIAIGSESVQYKEYAEWENQQKQTGKLEKQAEYWKKEFEGEIPILEIPMDGKRGKVEDSEGESIKFEIHETTVKRLKATAASMGGTLYMMLMAGYSILLSKYSGQEDIVVGSPIAGRSHAQMEKIAGMFVNNLAIRTQPEGEKSIKDYLLDMKKKLLGAYENQEYPYEKLIEDLKIKRDLSRNPLFDTMLILLNMDMKEVVLPNISIKPFHLNNKKAKLDITLIVVDAKDRLICEVEYRSKLYNKETITQMMEYYVSILNNISIMQDKAIKEIELLKPDEKQQLLAQFNNTKADYDKGKTLVELFELQVKKNPQKIALVWGDKQLTYQELNEKADKVSGHLRTKNIKPDDIVGVMVERSLNMYIAILGILKSRGAYLPLDPEYPIDRITYMLEDSKAKLLLTSEAFAQSIPFSGEILCIENALVNETADISISEENSLRDLSKTLAYVIYTSGSTGKPKGVMIEHQAVNNLIKGMTDSIDFSSDKAILALTTIGFDMSIPEVLIPLIKGVKIVIGDENVQKDLSLIKEIITKNNIDILHMTPSRLKMLLADEDLDFMKNVKEIITGAEAVPEDLVNALQKRTNAKIYNMYGPTEATVWATCADLTKSSIVHIGKPMANTRIYIVDKDNRLQPIGIPGEICIAGDGLARGYLNLAELTAEKFLPNPFEPGKRMYRTGDRAKWMPDGNIAFLGRMDNQVKIRGYRIELGEIESVIKSQQGVKDAVVIAKGASEDNKYLIAYLVLENTDIEAIKNSIKSRLPHYMLPASYILIEKIPLTDNGKVNKQALLNMQGTEVNRKKIPPRNFHDNTIAQIWRDVLNLEEVYIHDDFFQIGGNSINIIQIVNSLKQAFEVNITVADIMAYTTIIELSDYIANLDDNNSKEFKHAFKINKSKSKKNIFIIHGADGSIYYFRHLAKLLENEYSVYGLQPRGLNGEEPFPDSYFEMIHAYMKEIRMIQSEGPYIVAGYCIGGYLSYDIVNVFELQGDKVTALLQLDEEAFITKHTHKSIFLYRSILRVIDLWRKLTKKDKNYTMEKFMNLIPKAKPISKERQAEILKVRRSIQKYFGEELALNSYYANLGFIKTPTLVIKGEDNMHPLFKKELWENMVRGPLEYYVVPGDHETVMFPPYVDKFAEIILEYLSNNKVNSD